MEWPVARERGKQRSETRKWKGIRGARSKNNRSHSNVASQELIKAILFERSIFIGLEEALRRRRWTRFLALEQPIPRRIDVFR